MNNYQFLLDILEDQKRKKGGIELLREELAGNLNQQLIDELRDMTELDDGDGDEAEDEEEELLHDSNPNQIQERHSRINLCIQEQSSQRLVDEHLDPILQSQDLKTCEARNQTKSRQNTKTKLESNQNQNPTSNKRSKPHLDRKSNQFVNPRKGKRPNLNRDHLGANQRLIQDFFESSNFLGNSNHHQQFELDHQSELDSKFYSKFQLSKNLFLKIVNDLTKNDLHFTQRKDALGNLGHSSFQKVLVAFRQLTHGIGNQQIIMDDYIRMAESTSLECLIRFCHNINELYGTQYLRSPTESDLRRINDTNLNRGIPSGFIATLSFKYWQWNNRPTSWSGRFKTTSSLSSSSSLLPTIVLEALVSPDSWFWYAFFSTPGNCKDIDVFHPTLPIYSPKFQVPQFSTLHSHSSQLITAYYHAHPIYPPNPPIVSFINPQLDGASVIAEQQQKSKAVDFQSICRDDFDRAIDKLESRFQIIKLPCRLWSSNSMKVVIKAAMILHNMIIEDEQIHGKLPQPIDLNPIIHHSSQSTSTTSTPQPQAPHDIQVNPLLPNNAYHLQRPPIDVPPHVLQKLNNRFKLFNPNISLCA